ncbi:MAG: glucoamylase, partial [Solirubrobacteraceae bacterium]
MRRLVLMIVVIVAAISLEGEAVGASRSHARAPSGTRGVAPGAPGAKADWAPADKHGFGTSKTLASKVWFTLESGELSEVYYPRLDTPSYRDLQFVVTDGHSFAEREQDSTVQRTTLLDPHSLTYQQINTDKQHRWRLTKTYVTDPSR